MKFLNSLFILFSAMFYAQDFANFAKYEKDNAKIVSQNILPNAVFMGDSITEGWNLVNPNFFNEHNFVCRGISGQTTSQMLLRFRQDVINLKPKFVVILAGTNDIAENTGPISLDKVFENIVSMSELAKTQKIKVVLCSVLPAYDFGWKHGLEPARKILKLNEMIKNYAQKNRIPYVDYHSELKDDRNGLPSKYSDDEVHPNFSCYKKMEEIVMKYLK